MLSGLLPPGVLALSQARQYLRLLYFGLAGEAAL